MFYELIRDFKTPNVNKGMKAYGNCKIEFQKIVIE